MDLSWQGLRDLYAGALPGRAVALTRRFDAQGALRYQARSFDNQGNLLAEFTRILREHPDGSLELRRDGAWVHPECRGDATGVRVTDVELGLLRRLSSHPRTRLELTAGDSHGDRLGPYVWGAFGFRHATQDETLEPAAVRLKDGFLAWVDAQVAEGRLPLSDELLALTRDAAASWLEPYEVAHFALQGVQVLSEDGRPMDLGKAFLLTPEAPSWNAVMFANQPGSDSEFVYELYRACALDAADRQRATRSLERAEVLRGSDPQAIRDALWLLTLDGSAADLPLLVEAALRHPSLEEPIAATVAKIERPFTHALRELLATAASKDAPAGQIPKPYPQPEPGNEHLRPDQLPPGPRVDLAKALCSLQPTPRLEPLVGLAQSPNPELAWPALSALFELSPGTALQLSRSVADRFRGNDAPGEHQNEQADFFFALVKAGDRDATKVALRLLSRAGPGLRSLIARELGRCAPTAPAEVVAAVAAAAPPESSGPAPA